jgi:hypothetical protein
MRPNAVIPASILAITVFTNTRTPSSKHTASLDLLSIVYTMQNAPNTPPSPPASETPARPTSTHTPPSNSSAYTYPPQP